MSLWLYNHTVEIISKALDKQLKKPLINHKNTEDNKEKTISAKERFLDYDQRAKKKTTQKRKLEKIELNLRE